MRSRSKHKIQFTFHNTLYTQPEDNFIHHFSKPALEFHLWPLMCGQVWSFLLVVSQLCSKGSDFHTPGFWGFLIKGAQSLIDLFTYFISYFSQCWDPPPENKQPERGGIYFGSECGSSVCLSVQRRYGGTGSLRLEEEGGCLFTSWQKRRQRAGTDSWAGIETSRPPLFRLFLLKVLRPLTYVCACWPAEAREDITFPATGATDVHTDKHTE